MTRRFCTVACSLVVIACGPDQPMGDGDAETVATDDNGDGDGGGDVDGDGDGDGDPGDGDGDPGDVPMVGTDFLIDIHEVRINEYGVFLDDFENHPALPDVCSWKTSHEPDMWKLQTGGSLFEPVSYVDWCDAW